MDNGPFQVEVDQVTAAQWPGLMAEFADANLYQTWSYGAVRWGAENLSTLVLRRGGVAVAAACVRLVKQRLTGGGIAYMRWGPMFQRHGTEPDALVLRQMAEALKAEYAEKRKLYLRLLPNAFHGTPRAEAFQTAFPDFTQAAPGPAGPERTLVLNLTPSLEELRKALDQKWRNHLNRSERNNLTVVEGRGAEQYEAFLRIYREMMSRKHFETSVDVEEFGRILDDLPDSLKFRTLICEDKGVATNALVCAPAGGMGIYILGATNEAGLTNRGAYLLQWNMIRWLKENGFNSYDLGGIDPVANPGVYSFKKGFSGDDVTRLNPLDYCTHLPSTLLMKGADLARNRKNLVAGIFGKKSEPAKPSDAGKTP